MIHGCDWRCEKTRRLVLFFDHLTMSFPPCSVKSYGFHGNILTFSTSDFPMKIMGLSCNKSNTNCLVVSNIFFIFHFIYGMSSFPLTGISSRWLKPPTRSNQSIFNRSNLGQGLQILDRIDEMQTLLSLILCGLYAPLSTVMIGSMGREYRGHWLLNREKHDDFIGI